MRSPRSSPRSGAGWLPADVSAARRRRRRSTSSPHEPDEAREQLEGERTYWQGALEEFLRIRAEPTGHNKKARTLRIALEGGIRMVEARLGWLDDALDELQSEEWRRLAPG